jgi:hypothetical protein
VDRQNALPLHTHEPEKFVGATATVKPPVVSHSNDLSHALVNRSTPQSATTTTLPFASLRFIETEGDEFSMNLCVELEKNPKRLEFCGQL